MKIRKYVRKSISRQFFALICFFIILFIMGSLLLVYTQDRTYKTYLQNRGEIYHKITIARDIQEHVQISILDARGYIAFQNEEMKASTLTEKEEVRRNIQRLEDIQSTDQDKNLLSDLNSFYYFFFDETLPTSFELLENGEIEKVNNIAENGAISRIEKIQEEIKIYIASLNEQINVEITNLTDRLKEIQVAFLLYLSIVLLAVLLIGRIMLKRIGKPLSDFAEAANVIAAGKDAAIQVDKSREDELAILSVAFKRMYVSIQEKEQDLVAQNEELIAQQDELHAQQMELEKMLETVQHNEEMLKKRNEFIHGLSNSLVMQEILDSIIANMIHIIKADRGIIALINEDAFATYGISTDGQRQFKEHLTSGICNRLIKEKAPFVVKRELIREEKGYHLETVFVYDLYIPIFRANQGLAAVIMISRFSNRFSSIEKNEINMLAKQMSISLEKIRLFEQTEKERILYNDILNSVQEGILLVSPTGKIVNRNIKFMEMMSDVKGNLVTGSNWTEWTEQIKELCQDPEDWLQLMNDALNGQPNDSYITILKNKHVIHIYTEEINKGDDKFGTLFVFRDKTKEYEVDKMKSELVSTVSHELRTPLASILGFTELMINREIQPDRQHKYLTTIYGEAKRLTALINDFLDIQRMEIGKQAYEKKYMDILPIIQKVIETIRIDSFTHPIEWKINVDTSIILGDKGKLEQVLTNILSNAVKYSPNGGRIQIKIEKEEKELHVTFTDEGLGIPANSIDKLFTKFYRVDNSDRRKIGGTGLGLSIVQEIMHAHDGKVQVESIYGKGSAFTLIFPAIDTNIEHVENQPTLWENHYKVMIIEDDYSHGELIIQELRESGFQTFYCPKARDALQQIKEIVPDAVVLDIMLADDQLNGWDIIRKMKENEKLENIPIIVSTALDEKEKGISLGAMDYLIKPYQPSQLSKAIMQTLLKMGKVGQVLVPKD